MAKEIITAAMAGPETDLIGATILTGEDKPTVSAVYDSREDLDMVKSLRLPASLYHAAQQQNHPQGFSGVVRDALTAFLAEPDDNDIEHALAVLTNVVHQRRAA